MKNVLHRVNNSLLPADSISQISTIPDQSLLDVNIAYTMILIHKLPKLPYTTYIY